VFVGAGPDSYAAELRSLAAELGIGDDLIFTGGVSLAETVAFYRAADLLAYPSHNETFGLPILEAMACGCPVVTSQVSSMPEFRRAGEFTWAAAAASTLDVYREVAERRRRRRA
jgi:glycosyltransferase involved in cell wall biosynthesis